MNGYPDYRNGKIIMALPDSALYETIEANPRLNGSTHYGVMLDRNVLSEHQAQMRRLNQLVAVRTTTQRWRS